MPVNLLVGETMAISCLVLLEHAVAATDRGICVLYGVGDIDQDSYATRTQKRACSAKANAQGC